MVMDRPAGDHVLNTSAEYLFAGEMTALFVTESTRQVDRVCVRTCDILTWTAALMQV